jgi:hypothetical protein
MITRRLHPWHAFEVVGAADPVNWLWQPTQQALTEMLGDGWSAQIQHEGDCSREPCTGIPCPPILDRGALGYRAVLVSTLRAEGYGPVPLEAFDNLLRALS